MLIEINGKKYLRRPKIFNIYSATEKVSNLCDNYIHKTSVYHNERIVIAVYSVAVISGTIVMPILKYKANNIILFMSYTCVKSPWINTIGPRNTEGLYSTVTLMNTT